MKQNLLIWQIGNFLNLINVMDTLMFIWIIRFCSYLKNPPPTGSITRCTLFLTNHVRCENLACMLKCHQVLRLISQKVSTACPWCYIRLSAKHSRTLDHSRNRGKGSFPAFIFKSNLFLLMLTSSAFCLKLVL